MKFKHAAIACGTVIGVALALNAALAADPVSSPVPVAPKVKVAPPPKVDPRADKLLTATCKALGSAGAFSFHAELMFDQVLPSAVKVQYAGAIDFALQRPDELAIDYQSDLGGKSFGTRRTT